MKSKRNIFLKSGIIRAMMILFCTSCLTLASAQTSFKDENLQLLEQITPVSQNDLKNFMKKKGFSSEESGEKFDCKFFAFTNSSDQSIVVGYTNSGKLFLIRLRTNEDISGAESELENQQFRIEDDLLKKNGYRYFFRTDKGEEENSVILLTDQHAFTKPSKNDRLVTVDKLKEVLGQNSKSVQQLLAKKKYFYQWDLDDEKVGRHKEYFTDIEEDTEILVSFKDEKSFVIEVNNITVDDYNHVLQWLKTNKNEKMEQETDLFSKRDSWDILDGDYTVFLKYEDKYDFKPLKIFLRKND